MRRTQIYLGDAQTTLLDERAAAEGVTRSMVIRRAVDEYLSRDARDLAEWRRNWREAVGSTAGIASDLPDGAVYAEELRTADAARLRKLGA